MTAQNAQTSHSGVLIRDVSTEECPWLSDSLPAGKRVYEYFGCTYGCIGDGGVAVSDVADSAHNPFYEVPEAAVEWDTPE